MTKIDTVVVEVPVMQPIPDRFLLDHYPVPLPYSGPLTIRAVIDYMDEQTAAIKAYQADKAALRGLIHPPVLAEGAPS